MNLGVARDHRRAEMPRGGNQNTICRIGMERTRQGDGLHRDRVINRVENYAGDTFGFRNPLREIDREFKPPALHQQRKFPCTEAGDA